MSILSMNLLTIKLFLLKKKKKSLPFMPMMINMKKFLKRMIKISIRINKSYQIKIDSIINSLKSKRKMQKKKKFLWC